jgi:hypothetical protein
MEIKKMPAIIDGKEMPMFYEIIKDAITGIKHVTLESVADNVFNYSYGNSKLGKKRVLNFGMSIYHTCNHACGCYKEKKCYGMGGTFIFGSNMKKAAENFKYYISHPAADMVRMLQRVINNNPKIKLFRYFEIGDIPKKEFIDIMVELAENNPDIKFWTYTKKYAFVNSWLSDHDGYLPENLTIIFSHWLNDDGTYFPMPNPYNMPTSEFIPLGMEHLKDMVTHICPCSDPTVKNECYNCEFPCHELKRGQSMALLEHSTGRTKARDKAIKAAKALLK